MIFVSKAFGGQAQMNPQGSLQCSPRPLAEFRGWGTNPEEEWGKGREDRGERGRERTPNFCKQTRKILTRRII